MTKKIRREIAFLKSQEPIMNHVLWEAMGDVLESIVERIDQLEEDKTTRRGR